MRAPERFAQWLDQHRHTDKLGRVYNYHPRSDAHSIQLCECIIDDLLEVCQLLRNQAAQGLVVYGINLPFTWPTSGKSKTIDLAIGLPLTSIAPPTQRIQRVKSMKAVLFSCEAKAVMTEHGKAQPRLYDELSSSHEIVHQGDQQAIAAGVTVINIASSFVSPTRQKSATSLEITKHSQPKATEAMMMHLRGLPIRDTVGSVGFDISTIFIVDTDNQGSARLHTGLPAPQPGDNEYYETFLDRFAKFYSQRFIRLP